MAEDNELTMSIEDKLDEALAMLAAGMSLETVLAEVGEEAETLRPLLQIVTEAETLRAVPLPPPGASLQKMLAYAKTLSADAQATPPAKPNLLTRLASSFGMRGQPIVLTGVRMAALTAMVMFVFLTGTVLGGGITLAAQDSLPGQRLYSLKRLGETVRLGLVWTDSSLEQLQETYNQRRWMETNLLLKQGQEREVAFEANIRSVDGAILELDGLVIQIDPDTVVKGELTPGARIQLHAITRPPNTLVALTLTVIDPAPAMPISTLTVTSPATPTLTPSPTMTLTPTPTPVMSQDSDRLPTLTPTPMSSNDNADDSDDDNGNVNGDDANANDDDNDHSNENDDNDNGDDSNDNNNDDNDNGDDSNDNNNDNDANGNDDEYDNDVDGDISNDNGDDDSIENDDDEDNAGSGSEHDNSGKGNSDDRDNDDKDDDDNKDDDE